MAGGTLSDIVELQLLGHSPGSVLSREVNFNPWSKAGDFFPRRMGIDSGGSRSRPTIPSRVGVNGLAPWEL